MLPPTLASQENELRVASTTSSAVNGIQRAPGGGSHLAALGGPDGAHEARRFLAAGQEERPQALQEHAGVRKNGVLGRVHCAFHTNSPRSMLQSLPNQPIARTPLVPARSTSAENSVRSGKPAPDTKYWIGPAGHPSGRPVQRPRLPTRSGCPVRGRMK